MGKKRQISPNTYTTKECIMYLIGLTGQNMIYNIIGTGMAFYFQSVIFVPAIAISVIMAVARVWDAINDPMMGTIVDRTRTKYGKMRPYLMIVPAIVLVTTILTFVNGRYSADNSSLQNALIIGWAGVSYVMWGMSYTAGDIPIWGITSLMTEVEKDRSRLLGFARIVAGIGGGLVMLTMLPIAQGLGKTFSDGGMGTAKGNQVAFIIVAVVLTIVGCGLFQCASYVKERVKQPSDEHKGFLDNFKIMWNCKPFRRILISGVIRSPMQILSLVAMTLLSYYYGDYNSKNYTLYMIILGGGMFAGQFAAMALVPMLCSKYEKKSIYNVLSLISVVPFVALFVVYLIDGSNLMHPAWIAVMTVLFALAGAGVGASMVLQSIMIADCVDYDEYRTGYRPDGVFFSGQSFITKLGAGISSLIQGVVFAVVGFSGSAVQAANEVLEKAPADTFVFATSPDFASYRTGMFFLVTIPPAIGILLSVLPMLKYELSNGDHTRILDELNAKRNADSSELETEPEQCEVSDAETNSVQENEEK